MKFLEETLRESLLNFNLGRHFLNNSLKSQTTKGNIDEFIKTRKMSDERHHRQRKNNINI